MEKEVKITIPEGYEIDKEKSTFEKIVFKKKQIVNCWDDLEIVRGCYLNTSSKICPFPVGYVCATNRNLYINEKYAKSALALAQISQLLPYYDSNVDWSDDSKIKYVITRNGDKIEINRFNYSYHVMAFNTLGEANRFLEYNKQLVEDYFML